MNWTNIGCAYPFSSPVPFLHADHHEIEYSPSGTLYTVNDGGICSYTGSSWTDLTDPMNIAQIYKLGLSSLSPNLWITGHQDNGSNIYNNGIYSASLAADGADCFIDYTNDKNIFASLPNSQLYNQVNGGPWTVCTSGSGAAGGWITPWKQDPQVATTFWLGKTQMFKSITGGSILWNQTTGSMTGITAGEYVKEFAVAPSNNQYIYVIHGTSGMQVSIDGGATWNQRNNGLTVATMRPSFVVIDPTNPQTAWITISGYSGNNKVYKTTNAGGLWVNISNGNLPNISANCAVYELGNTNGRIYIGMDVGVYYVDNSSPIWQLYNTGLPNTPVSDLEISPAAPTKLRASTYGRGVYQVDIVPNNAAPVTAFNYMGNICAVPTTLTMNDNSTNSPTSWSWSVTSATGVTINTPTVQAPPITFANAGTYTISLTATNSFGSGALSTQVVTIGSPALSITPTTTTICLGQSFSLTGSGANTYTWQPGNKIGSVATYTPITTKNYTLSATGPNGCISTDTITIFVGCTGVLQNGNTTLPFHIFPNPANDKLVVHVGVTEETEFLLELLDINGGLIISKSVQFTTNNNEELLNISMVPKGIYLFRVSSKGGVAKTIKLIKD